MKKIINGKLYNTDTAREVASYSSPGSSRDFSHYCETLYCKKTGEYFLFGKGGPMTKYAEKVDSNSWSGGSDISPLSFDQAREWSEQYLTADEYEKEFGEIQEDDSTVLLSISLASSTATKLRRMAQENGISVSAMIAKLVEK